MARIGSLIGAVGAEEQGDDLGVEEVAFGSSGRNYMRQVRISFSAAFALEAATVRRRLSLCIRWRAGTNPGLPRTWWRRWW